MAGRSRTTTYLVYWDAAALVDLEGLQDRGERKSVFNSVEKLRQLGPQLIRPHAGKLTGRTDLLELRPKGGDTYVRPIYGRRGEGEFVILAVSVEPDKADFDKAVANAQERYQRYRPKEPAAPAAGSGKISRKKSRRR